MGLLGDCFEDLCHLSWMRVESSSLGRVAEEVDAD